MLWSIRQAEIAACGKNRSFPTGWFLLPLTDTSLSSPPALHPSSCLPLVLPIIFTYFWSRESLWFCGRYRDLTARRQSWRTGLQRTTSPCPPHTIPLTHHPHRVLCPMGWGSLQPFLNLHQFQIGVLSPAEPMSPQEMALSLCKVPGPRASGFSAPSVPSTFHLRRWGFAHAAVPGNTLGSSICPSLSEELTHVGPYLPEL